MSNKILAMIGYSEHAITLLFKQYYFALCFVFILEKTSIKNYHLSIQKLLPKNTKFRKWHASIM